VAVRIERGGDELDADAKRMRENPSEYFAELLKEERAEIKQGTKILSLRA
jgi:hypothetical protein